MRHLAPQQAGQLQISVNDGESVAGARHDRHPEQPEPRIYHRKPVKGAMGDHGTVASNPANCPGQLRDSWVIGYAGAIVDRVHPPGARRLATLRGNSR